MTEGGEPFRKCASGWRNASQGTLQLRRIQTNKMKRRRSKESGKSKYVSSRRRGKLNIYIYQCEKGFSMYKDSDIMYR